MKTRIIALFAGLLAALPMTSAWAYSVDFYAKLTAKVATDSTGLGKVYVESGTPGESCTATAKASVSYTSPKPSSGDVTVKASVDYDKDAVAFLGWSTTGKSADISATSESYSVTKTASGTSESTATDFGTVYAHFKTVTLEPFSITFGQSGPGSYTVNGNPAENLSGLTAATVVKLASSDPNFFCWKINGKTFVDNPYTTTCKEDTTIAVEFLTDANVAEIADADALVELLTYDEIKKIIIPAGKNVYIERGTTVTIPDGKMLTVDGNLFVEGSLSGTIAGNGKVSKCTTFIQQTGVDGLCGPEAIPFASWPGLGVVYWTTTTDSYKATVTGTCNTPDGVLEHVKLVNGKGGVVRSAQEKRTSTVFYAGVDTSVAMNHITSIGAQAVINTIHASGHAGTFKLLTGTTTYNGEGTNGGNKYAHNWGVTDCAGNALTIAKELGGGSGFKLINGSVTISGSVQATDTYFINCTKAQAKTYHSDTAKVQSFRFFETTGIDIKTTMATGGDGARFYSGKYDVTLKGTNWKVAGGAFKNDPNEFLVDKVNYEAKQRPEDNYWVVVPKAPPECVATVGDAQYTTLEEAIANTTSGTIKLQGHVSLLNPVEIAPGQSLTIELEGYKITGDSGVFVNRGTLVLNDGTNNDAPSYVTAEGGYLFDNYGTLEITRGYYSGKVRLNAGNFITHGGTFNVAMEAGEGVTDKAAVAEIRGGVFKTDSNVAAEAEVVDAATQYVGGFLDEGFVAVPYDGALWIGSDQYAICQEISLSGAEKAWRLTAIDSADQELYIRNPPTRADCKDDAEWKRFQEVTTWIKPYSTKVIDCVLEFDHDIAPGSLTAVVSFLPQTLDEAIPANTLYSALIPRITAYQIAYSRFINDSDWNLLDCGIKNNSLDNIGTTCNIYMYLCNQNRDKLVDLKWTYTYSNFRPIAKCTYKFTGKGAICGDKDYDSLAEALAEASDGGTVRLSRDCAEDVTISKSCVVDLNGFEFTGSFVKGEGVEETVEGDIHTFVAPEQPTIPVIAMIGDVEYASLAAAVRAAGYSKDGVEIVLCENTDEKVTLPAWVRINLNGHKAVNLACPNGYELREENGRVMIIQVNVAMIGNESYTSLASAIDAANNGAVVKLLKTTDEEVSVGVVCTIVKNGFECPNVSADEENLFEFAEDNGVIAIAHPKVARVGEQYYTDIQDAVDAAVEQDKTVVLVWECADEIVFDAPCTVNLDVTGYNFLGDVVVSAANLSVSQRFSSDHIMTLTVAEAKQVDVTVSSSDTKDENAAAKVSSELVATIASTVGDRDDETEAEKQQRVEKAVQEYVAGVISSGEHASVGFAEVVKTVEVKDGKEVTKTEIKNELSETVNDRPAAKDLKSGVYQQTKIYGGGADGGNFAVADMSVDAITVIKTDSSDDTLMLAVPGDKTENGEPFTVKNVIASDKVLGDEIRVYVNENGASGFRTWVWTDKDGCGDDLHWHPIAPIGGSEVQPCKASDQQLKAGDTFQYTRKGHHKPVTVVAAYKGDIKTEIKDQGTTEAGGTAWNMVANPVPAAFDIQLIKPVDSVTDIEKDSIVVPASNGEGEKIFRRKEGRWGYNKTVVGEKTIGGKKRKVATSQWIDSGDDTKIGVGKGFWYLSAGGKPTIDWKVGDAK